MSESESGCTIESLKVQGKDCASWLFDPSSRGIIGVTEGFEFTTRVQILSFCEGEFLGRVGASCLAGQIDTQACVFERLEKAGVELLHKVSAVSRHCHPIMK